MLAHYKPHNSAVNSQLEHASTRCTVWSWPINTSAVPPLLLPLLLLQALPVLPLIHAAAFYHKHTHCCCCPCCPCCCWCVVYGARCTRTCHTYISQLREREARLGELVDQVVDGYHTAFTRAINNYSKVLQLFNDAQQQLQSTQRALHDSIRHLSAQSRLLNQQVGGEHEHSTRPLVCTRAHCCCLARSNSSTEQAFPMQYTLCCA
jgi:hypothetical protein